MKDSVSIKILLFLLICNFESVFAQNIKIQLNEKSMSINDSIIFDDGKFKHSCFKEIQVIIKSKNKIKRVRKKIETYYFFTDLGLELEYIWKNSCNLNNVNIFYIPYSNSLYKGGKRLKEYNGTLNLLGINITNQTTANEIMKNSFFSDESNQILYKKKGFVEYTNKNISCTIFFNGEKIGSVTFSCTLKDN